jgi:hypothetical protein
MSALTDRLPGWFKRKGEREETTPAANSTPSITTGGGLDQEPVVVWDAANVMEAEIVKGRLESEGIPAFIRSEAVGGLYGLTAGNLAAAQVFVPAPLAEKALDLLTGDEDVEAAPTDDQMEESFPEDEEQGAA